jgi:hypothetical protein
MGAYDCPAQNSTIYTSPISPSTPYTIICNADQPDGVDAITPNTLVRDLNTGLVASSIEACIDLCIGAAIGSSTSSSCTAVTYGANITLALSRGGITGNCFLKNERARDFLLDQSDVVSAFRAD